MIIAVSKRKWSIKAKNKYTHIVLLCDECGIYFEKESATYLLKTQYHFCSQICVNDSQRYGILNNKKTNYFLDKYDSTSPFGNKNIIEKCKEKRFALYGHEYYSNWEQSKKTLLEKTGYEFTFQNPETHNKGLQKKEELYGDKHYNNIEKRIKTCIETWDVEHYVQSDDFKSKTDYTDNKRKQHKTMKKNGYYKESQSNEEKKFYIVLCDFFNKDDIKMSALVNNNLWPIDFFIKSINTYIQYDGVYWHGLDRPIEEIKKFKTNRDKAIYRKYCTDKAQKEWFKDNNLALVRVRSDEFYNALKNNTIKVLFKKKGLIE